MVETYEHRYLKELAEIWLREQHYLLIGSEINLSAYPERKPYEEAVSRYRQLTLGRVAQTWENRHICDVVGIRDYYSGTHYLWACGVEAKVSREDYLRGFCFERLNQHYIIAPRGLIPKSTLPRGVGLIEVHDPHLEEMNELWGSALVGVEIAKCGEGYHVPLKDMDDLIFQIGRHASMHRADMLRRNLPSQRRPEFGRPQFSIQKRLARGRYVGIE